MLHRQVAAVLSKLLEVSLLPLKCTINLHLLWASRRKARLAPIHQWLKPCFNPSLMCSGHPTRSHKLKQRSRGQGGNVAEWGGPGVSKNNQQGKRELGFPGGSGSKESVYNAGDLGSIPGSGRSPRGGHGNPLQYSCLENPHGQRSLAGCSPWGCKESDMTKRLSTQEGKWQRSLKQEHPWERWPGNTRLVRATPEYHRSGVHRPRIHRPSEL